jgi:hypothetical protein
LPNQKEMQTTIKELKTRAIELGIDTSSILEKPDLAAAVEAAEASKKRARELGIETSPSVEKPDIATAEAVHVSKCHKSRAGTWYKESRENLRAACDITVDGDGKATAVFNSMCLDAGRNSFYELKNDSSIYSGDELTFALPGGKTKTFNARDLFRARNLFTILSDVYTKQLNAPGAHGCDSDEVKITRDGAGTYSVVPVDAIEKTRVKDAHKTILKWTINPMKLGGVLEIDFDKSDPNVPTAVRLPALMDGDGTVIDDVKLVLKHDDLVVDGDVTAKKGGFSAKEIRAIVAKSELARRIEHGSDLDHCYLEGLWPAGPGYACRWGS